MTRINLLPWRERRRERRRRVLLGQAAATFAGVVACVAAVGIHIDGWIERQQRRNQYLATAVAALDARIDQIQGLRRERDELQSRMALLVQLGSDRNTLVHVLDGIARTLVPGLHYTGVAKRGVVVTVRGAAESNDGVASLMRNIDAAAAFGVPNLKSIAETGATAGDGPTTVFELTFEVAKSAVTEVN